MVEKLIKNIDAARLLGYGKHGKVPDHLLKSMKKQGVEPVGATGGSNGARYKLWALAQVEKYIKDNPNTGPKQRQGEIASTINDPPLSPDVAALILENNAMLRAFCHEWKMDLDSIWGAKAIEEGASNETEEKEDR